MNSTLTIKNQLFQGKSLILINHNQREKMNEQQKIELGELTKKEKEFILKAFEFFGDGQNWLNFLRTRPIDIWPTEKAAIAIMDSIRGKIQEQSKLIPPGPRNMCGACGQSYPPEELAKSFEVCDSCKKEARLKPTCEDKNGKVFTTGNRLKNEQSSQWTRVIHISDNHIGTDQGMFLRDQFVADGWVVHERVTAYTVIGGSYYSYCEFEKVYIGDRFCKKDCPYNKGSNISQQWVICELYNKEHQEFKQ